MNIVKSVASPPPYSRWTVSVFPGVVNSVITRSNLARRGGKRKEKARSPCCPCSLLLGCIERLALIGRAVLTAIQTMHAPSRSKPTGYSRAGKLVTTHRFKGKRLEVTNDDCGWTVAVCGLPAVKILHETAILTSLRRTLLLLFIGRQWTGKAGTVDRRKDTLWNKHW
jgi:hypothetical protein